MFRNKFTLTIVFLFLFASSNTICWATQFHIGPGQQFTAINEVPWEELNPGDQVYIHWRSTNYKEKWVIGRSGTEAAPIVVTGVPGPQGQLPVIDGRDATTRQNLNFWNERRGLIKIGGSNTPSELIPSYIIIENLDLRSARPPYSFTNDSGQQETYANNAASFYVEIGQHLTIRNCIIHDSGNGIFIGANHGRTKDILIESNYIYDNGIEGRYLEHNTYTAAIGITYQYNFMGALRSGADGNNLKDRSAGLVVRYNWIENGNRQLDLVDAEDTDVIVNDPAYRKTYVYGNVLKEKDNEGNSQIIHYGGDSDNEKKYRKGTLYLFNNTLISTRSGNTTLVRLSTDDEHADVHNNIFYTTASGSRFALMSSSGEMTIRKNWLKSGWKKNHSLFSGTLIDDETSVEGNSPGFEDFAQDNYHLAVDSAARDAGVALDSDLLDNHPLTLQYKYHRQSETRPEDGSIDIGAFEFISGIQGDIDGNGAVEIHDAVLGLQLISNTPPIGNINPNSDVNGDLKLGLAEVLFIFRQIATPNS